MAAPQEVNIAPKWRFTTVVKVKLTESNSGNQSSVPAGRIHLPSQPDDFLHQTSED